MTLSDNLKPDVIKKLKGITCLALTYHNRAEEEWGLSLWTPWCCGYVLVKDENSAHSENIQNTNVSHPYMHCILQSSQLTVDHCTNNRL